MTANLKILPMLRRKLPIIWAEIYRWDWLPLTVRYTMMVIGMMVKPEEFNTRNIIIGLDARSFLGLISCNSFIAFNPIGVAALSNPNILAEIFIKILPIAGWSLGISGKIFEKKGPTNLEKALIIPPFSPIFMMPNHKANTPVRPREISKPVLAESKVAFMISEKIWVFPKRKAWKQVTMKAISKKPIQM